MVTLPHGLNKILDQIFGHRRQSSMLPKVFGALIVVLLSTFCSVEDEVMSNTSLVIHLADDELPIKLTSINSGDTLFNTGFFPCRKN
jgi:hypothetical protein